MSDIKVGKNTLGHKKPKETINEHMGTSQQQKKKGKKSSFYTTPQDKVTLSDAAKEILRKQHAEMAKHSS